MHAFRAHKHIVLSSEAHCASQELDISGRHGRRDLVLTGDKIHIKLNFHGTMTVTRCQVMCARAITVHFAVFCSEMSPSLPGLGEVEYENSVIMLNSHSVAFF